MNLSQQELIALEIYRYNKRKEPIYFSKLVDIFKNRIDRRTINTVLDTLFDLCIIEADWAEYNKKWIRTIHMSSAYIKYFQNLELNCK